MSFSARLTLLLRRLAAAFYDSLLLIALWFAGTGLVLALRSGMVVPAGTVWFELYLWVLGFLFCGWFWTRGGQTLGLRAWKLRVTAAAGTTLNWRQALLRYFLAGPCWISGIGILWSLLDREGRAWHELASGTRLQRTA